jgi:hypothetical protein
MERVGQFDTTSESSRESENVLDEGRVRSDIHEMHDNRTIFLITEILESEHREMLIY